MIKWKAYVILTWKNLVLGGGGRGGGTGLGGGDFPGGSVVRNPPMMQDLQESGFDPRVGKIPMEEGMATHFSILAWRISWTEEHGRLQSIGLQRVEYDWATNTLQV